MLELSFEDAVFRHSMEDVWGIVDNHREIRIKCDDGMLEIPTEDFLFNYICWQVFDVLPRNFNSSVRYSVHLHDHITTRTHLDICGDILKDYVMLMESEGVIPDIDPFKIKVYELTNLLYNQVDDELSEYTTDLRYDHLLEIYKHPEINSVIQTFEKQNIVGHDEIQHVYKTIIDNVLKHSDLNNNPLCVAARCGTIKLTQLSMVIGPVGYCTDINSKIIPHPVKPGFFRGLSKLDDMLYESRNASIAALFNIVIMPLAEYANRREQLPAENIQYKVVGDCGGNSEKIYVIDKQHLKSLAGFNLTNGPSGKIIKYIDKNDTDLIGRNIYVRSINYCRHKSRNGICTTCIGLLHYSFPTRAVIGHCSATQIGSATSTAVLQRKHQNLTSKAEGLEVDELYQNFFKVDGDGHGLKFNNDFDYKNWDIILNTEAALHLKEVNGEFGDSLTPSQTTKIKILELRSKEGLDSLLMPIGEGQRAGFLTKEMLTYLKSKGWTYADGNVYVLDLSEWNNTEEFLTIPQIEFTPPDLIDATTEFIFSGRKIERDDAQSRLKPKLLANCHTVDEAYATFYELIKDHLKVHSAHLMMMILAMSVQDEKEFDFRLPYPRENSRTTKLDNVMFYRSAGGAIAYEEQNQFFLNPMTYLIDRRPPHIYDSIVMG